MTIEINEKFIEQVYFEKINDTKNFIEDLKWVYDSILNHLPVKS